VKPDEGRLTRRGWRALGRAGRVVGARVGRGTAAILLRVRARTAEGWLEGVHRVASRPALGAPGLTRLLESWWTASPEMRVRRLGLRLELDLRDNLQRVLYATGTYDRPCSGSSTRSCGPATCWLTSAPTSASTP
jgi:hypothetical protein